MLISLADLTAKVN